MNLTPGQFKSIADTINREWAGYSASTCERLGAPCLRIFDCCEQVATVTQQGEVLYCDRQAYERVKIILDRITNNEPQPGDYRAVQLNDDVFTVQCAQRTSDITAVPGKWWQKSTTKKRESIVWRTLRDNSAKPINVPDARIGIPPMYPALTFGTLAAAQAYIDKLRHIAATYPIIHPLN